jgi:hypothetical protein
MQIKWKDQDLEQVLKNLNETEKVSQASNRVWARIESRLSERETPWLNHKVWRPLGHPIRWVMAASFLLAAIGVALYQNQFMEQADLNAYLLNISNPTENIAKDSGEVRVSSIISETPNQEGAVILIGDEERPAIQTSEDDLLL